MLSASRSTFGVVAYTRTDPALSFYRRLALARLWQRFPLTKSLSGWGRGGRTDRPDQAAAALVAAIGAARGGCARGDHGCAGLCWGCQWRTLG